ncbi:MAG: class I SAM-dependent methyltransferase [Vicinamibacterales bacterium]
MSEGPGHYSYTFYADAKNARAFDQRRFGGPIGDLVAAGQADVLTRFLGPVNGRSILDVGTGTGRAAFLMADLGAQVTGVDASEEMLAVARERARDRVVPITFATGDAHALGFADRAFDIAVSLRVLMHTPRWGMCVDELCRVSRHRVIVDYPSAHSVALVQSLARKVRYAFGGATEPYRVFGAHQIAAAFARNNFRIVSTHRQFVLPIALHKTIGSRRFTETSERALAAVGLLRLLGSPVTVVAERCEPS